MSAICACYPLRGLAHESCALRSWLDEFPHFVHFGHFKKKPATTVASLPQVHADLGLRPPAAMIRSDACGALPCGLETDAADARHGRSGLCGASSNSENRAMQRFTRSCWSGGLALVLLGVGALPAAAADASAELAVGGLVFPKSADISIESQDLTITPEAVTIRYKFLNQSPNPVTLMMAFPLPDLDLSAADNYAIPTSDSTNFVGFETKVDGKPAPFTINQRAFLGSKDVSGLLRSLGAPLFALGVQHDKLAELPQATRDKLIDEGLLVQAGQTEQGKPIYDAGWTVKTSA